MFFLRNTTPQSITLKSTKDILCKWVWINKLFISLNIEIALIFSAK